MSYTYCMEIPGMHAIVCIRWILHCTVTDWYRFQILDYPNGRTTLEPSRMLVKLLAHYHMYHRRSGRMQTTHQMRSLMCTVLVFCYGSSWRKWRHFKIAKVYLFYIIYLSNIIPNKEEIFHKHFSSIRKIC